VLRAGDIKLSGGNDNSAKNLRACVGECDAGQCAAGLQCFQREDGEAIPGCTGAGGGDTWDYCFEQPTDGANPSKKPARSSCTCFSGG